MSDSTQEKAAVGNEMWDILIIGGGIVGSGVARDAAMRGLRTALVEQYDFASGTSSRSSRLLHGGLRYLAQGRVGLVHEASVEKKVIHRIAPHLADPLAFVFPTYRGNREWVLWQLKIGVKIYDLLCGGRNLGRSTWLNRQQMMEYMPFINPENLNGAVRYYDGLTNDARLVLDTLRSAARAGAKISNYTKAESFNHKGGYWECTVFDKRNGRRYTIRTRAIVNAAGPWAQGLGKSQVKLRLTKGIHVVVEKSRVPVQDAVVMTEGSRILFAIPWGERTILGTTDTDYNDAPENVKVEEQDVDYVLKITNAHFPKASLTAKDLVGSWAGLRPLIANPNGNPSDISRSHEIRNPAPGWWDVAGGKLTTYRLMAEQTVDEVTKKLSLKCRPCRTAEEPLIPSSERNGVSGIVPPEFSRDAVEYYLREEWANSVEDIMVRRTSWQHYHRESDQMAEQVKEWMEEIACKSDASASYALV